MKIVTSTTLAPELNDPDRNGDQGSFEAPSVDGHVECSARGGAHARRIGETETEMGAVADEGQPRTALWAAPVAPCGSEAAVTVGGPR